MKGIQNMKTTTLKLLAIGALALAGAPAAFATAVVDPAGDFLPTYTGPQAGDLDVIGISVILDGSDFVLTATLNGAVGTTTGARYIWGVNRGAGAPGFASIGLNGVLFDAVIALANTGAAPTVLGTALPANAVTISGSTISLRIASSILPSTGFTPEQYGFNLWPRAPGNGNAFLSDFAPNNSTISVPEPATLGVMLFGLAGALATRRRQLQRG